MMITVENQADAPGYEDWPFEEVTKSHRAFKRAQKQKFQDYIVEHDPELAAALAEEAARFDIVRRDVIEPMMHEAANLAAARGFSVFVTSDEAMDRLVLLASPSIRFYCSRIAFETPVVDMVSSPSFMAFYGCPKTQTIQSYVEISAQDADLSRSYAGRPLNYQDASEEEITVRLLDFVGGLTNVGIKF